MISINPSTCESCNNETRLTPEGLCVPCQNELRFVLRPVAHREEYRRRIAGEASTRQETVVINMTPEDNSLWVCDFCDAAIPADNEYTLISLLASYALCPPCTTTLPYWPDAWTQPAPRACRCGACQLPLLEASLHEQRRSGRTRDRRSLGEGMDR